MVAGEKMPCASNFFLQKDGFSPKKIQVVGAGAAMALEIHSRGLDDMTLPSCNIPSQNPAPEQGLLFMLRA